MFRVPEIVWLLEERTFGILVKMGSFYSTVRYTRDGYDYEVLIENNDYELWEEHALDYETDE